MKRHRCHDCGHPPRRVISATRQPQGGNPDLHTPRVRKKPCDCPCHRAGDTIATPQDGAA